MLMEHIQAVQDEFEDPDAEQSEVLVDIEDYCFDHGVLHPYLPLRAELQQFFQADQRPGQLRRFVKAAAAGLRAFGQRVKLSPEAKQALHFYTQLRFPEQ